ncbi:MAG: hypothetical protein ABL883_09905 [Terricaulis sp.]
MFGETTFFLQALDLGATESVALQQLAFDPTEQEETRNVARQSDTHDRPKAPAVKIYGQACADDQPNPTAGLRPALTIKIAPCNCVPIYRSVARGAPTDLARPLAFEIEWHLYEPAQQPQRAFLELRKAIRTKIM